MLHFIFILIVCFLLAALVEAVGWKTVFKIIFLVTFGLLAMFLVWATGMAVLAWITWDFFISILGIAGIL